jgi:hypothetical protein
VALRRRMQMQQRGEPPGPDPPQRSPGAPAADPPTEAR